ncbi:family 10 glycosylhydrolase [Cyanobium sp. CH-040]|nr:family 10 glycosylhydrolase [Cyanobium sp. CH-040]
MAPTSAVPQPPAGLPRRRSMARLSRFARLKALLPVSLTLLLTGLQPIGARAQVAGRNAQRPPAASRIGVWLTNSPSPLYYDPARIERAVNELAAAGFTTLYPNVWSRGTTFHRSRWAPMEPQLEKANPNLDPICRMTRAAQRRGMEVFPWFEYGLMEPATAEVVKRQPEWVLQRRDGSTGVAMHGTTMVWLNPAHPGVRERFIGLITEIVQRCGVDGIQLDDHFAWPVELGYDPYTRQLYRQATGQEPPANHTDRFWMRWRRQQLTDLLRELRASLRELDEQARRSGKGTGHPTWISLSPGPFRFAYNRWLQDWELWSVGSLVDDLVVQNYAYSVQGFARDLNQPALVKAREWGMPVEIGILAGFGGRTPDMATLTEKVRLAKGRGHGVIYFYWEGLWGEHAGREGAEFRQRAFRDLHRSLPRPTAAAGRR